MSAIAGPSVPLSGMILHLDAADQNSYDGRENLLLYSEQLDNAAWGKNNVTVAADITTTTFNIFAADRITETSDVAGQYHSISQTITKPASSIQYTFSVYARTAGREILGLRMESSGNGVVFSINLNTGAVVTAAGTYGTGFSGAVGSTTNVGGGWYRIALTVTTNTSTSMLVQLYLQDPTSSVYIGNGTSGAFVWGVQLEGSSVATPYAQTVASSLSRGTTWADLSGQNNISVLTNGPTYSPDNNGAIVFDGSNDFVVVNSLTSIMPTAAYTKIAWFFLTSYLTNNNIISGYNGQHAFWMKLEQELK